MKKSKKKLIIIAALIVIIIAAAYSCSTGKEMAQQVLNQNMTVKVERGDLYKTIPARGYVNPIEEKNLSFPANTGGSTKIEKIHVTEGDRVDKGQLLIQLDKTEAELNYMQRLNTYNRAKINGSINEREEARLNLQLAEKSLKNTELKAPFSGVITDIYIEEENYYSSGEVITIKDISQLKVEVSIAENNIPEVKLGQKAEATLKSLPGKVINGEVTDIDDEADNTGGTVVLPVTVTLDKVDEDIKINSSAELDIIVEKVEDVIVVPVTAVVSQEEKEYVIKAIDDTEERVEVKTGLTDGLKIEVESGIEEGEEIIVNTFRQGMTPPNSNDIMFGVGGM